ncbi:MAG TPA: virulence protein SciE type [Solibacterales bacterium]|nr:virulence protein SciE type [Bryobacterales bacterium]
MTARALFQEGKVTEATQALAAFLRDHPTDVQQRTFLFELLCFAGQFDRAEKQLAVLAQGGDKTEMGAVLYYSALHAERLRHDLFRNENFPHSPVTESGAGTLNGKPFQSIRDMDPDIGPRLEVFAAGAYVWIPFEHIESVEFDEPKRLRDTLWAPALVLTGPAFKQRELGQVLVPVVYPFSSNHPDENVWLGRQTAWGEDERGRAVPSGQKMLLVDGEEIPLLEVRKIEFAAHQAADE